jgi:hypothetical protein
MNALVMAPTTEWGYNVRLFLLYTFLSTAFRGVWDQHVMSLFVYLITNGSNYRVGLLTGVSGIAQICCTFATATIGDRYPRHVILRHGSEFGIAAILLSICAILLSHFSLLFLSMVLWGFYWAITNPTLDAMIADSIERGSRSHVYSWVATIRFLGRAFGPLASVLLFLWIGNDWSISQCQLVMTEGLILFALPVILLSNFRPVENPESDVVTPTSSHEALGSSSTDPFSPLTYPCLFLSLLCPSSSLSLLSVDPIYCSLCPSLLYIPSMIALADIISGLASGMTIKFFPIFFANDLQLSPIEVSLVIMVRLSPLPLPPSYRHSLS